MHYNRARATASPSRNNRKYITYCSVTTMPMNARLLRPIASSVHPDAAAWRSAVVANGGGVSASTMRAVSTFCASIDAAGIRDKFYRLNLFCGNELAACLVPLYRGPSRTGTQHGGAAETNENFVSGDYTETGVNGGLKGNGTNKRLLTGMNANVIPSVFDSHMSYSARELELSSANFRDHLGVFGGSSATAFFAQNNRQFNRIFGMGNFNSANLGFNADEPHALGVRSANTTQVSYRSGSSIGTENSVATDSLPALALGVFARSDVQTSFTAGRFRMYSFGLSMTGAQALAFANAVIAFNAALTRT